MVGDDCVMDDYDMESYADSLNVGDDDDGDDMAAMNPHHSTGSSGDSPPNNPPCPPTPSNNNPPTPPTLNFGNNVVEDSTLALNTSMITTELPISD